MPEARKNNHQLHFVGYNFIVSATSSSTKVRATVEFRVPLPKHHVGIDAVERIIGSIKNTVGKSVFSPHQLRMDDKELLTWIHL